MGGLSLFFLCTSLPPVARLRICKPVSPSVSWLSGTGSRVRACDGLGQLYLRLERFRNADLGIAIPVINRISHICQEPAVILAGYIQRGIGEIPSYEYLFT
ncbi:hypothetical protein HOY82DRAFT_575729 [Tuber indicum]|nr:hypothetical protein HOY82DRAFT_575729 [Tuber indicum]